MVSTEFLEVLNYQQTQIETLNRVIDVLVEWQDKVFEIYPDIDSEM